MLSDDSSLKSECPYSHCLLLNSLRDIANFTDSEKEELDVQLRAIPDIERRIAELTAA
jgi:hypothetical protein